MKVIFYTLGCKVNQYETQAIRELFFKEGFSSALKGEIPDVAVVNSCTVTAESDRKTRQIVRRIRRQFPNVVLVLIGCMPQAFPDSAKKIEEADIIRGNRDNSDLVSSVKAFLKDKNRRFEVLHHQSGDKYSTPAISSFNERTRAYMKIEDGCDRFCSYCAIPYARGRVRSRSVLDIKDEALRLSLSGYKEIVLVGINLSAFGKDSGENLADAVEAVAAVDGILRVRLGSLEPDQIDDDILKRLKAIDKFCPQFHLSLQSGCDATLKRMNRHYDTAFYYDLVSRIRKIFPDPSITTDVMVGFMGETDEEFKESVNFVKKIGFSKIHVFAYSVREGTRAASFSDPVEEEEKRKRSDKMLSVANDSHGNFLKTQQGNVYPVLFEHDRRGFCEGYTPNYTRVAVKNASGLSGTVRNVCITETDGELCFGELV